jgi:hypothetical protein
MKTKRRIPDIHEVNELEYVTKDGGQENVPVPWIFIARC